MSEEQSGLTRLISDVMSALGEIGVGIPILLETLFPPIPSELVLPLAGFLSQQGRMNAVFALVLATLGSYAGAVVLYLVGARLGEERAVRWLSKLPLVNRDDFERAAGWVRRHGRSAVFFGRLIPGVKKFDLAPGGSRAHAVWDLHSLHGRRQVTVECAPHRSGLLPRNPVPPGRSILGDHFSTGAPEMSFTASTVEPCLHSQSPS